MLDQVRSQLVIILKNIFIICISILALLQMFSSPEPRTSLDAPTQIGPLPWHLVRIWFDTKKTAQLQSVAVDLEIGNDVSEKSSIFVVPIYGRINGASFYAGLISNIPEAQKTGRTETFYNFGHGLIFTRWGEKSLDGIRHPSGGLYLSSDHEGSILSSRTCYAWRKGKYTLKVVRMDGDNAADREDAWFASFLYSHDSREDVYMGSLRFEGRTPASLSSLTAFVEIFDDTRKKVSARDIPVFDIRLSNYRINGTKIDRIPLCMHYPEGSPDYAEAVVKSDGIHISTGRALKKRDARLSHSLLEQLDCEGNQGTR